ncbi:hypothetical protein HAZT_HAZT004022 [Hyalella azteca]|uniref:GB1/RHD3-type G domain-containing protein n=1 Tax=Hyalella azteca TaxID=294128 RepID=A0A6A0GSU2_HYAAZ|nr:hypothetical protein HAZT_HAZT004022 [Hyalella azteca]
MLNHGRPSRVVVDKETGALKGDLVTVARGLGVDLVLQHNDLYTFKNLQKEGSREFELNEEALMSVLHRPEVRDTALCVVSIAGAFRKGKSFFMNCLLKYCMNKGSPDWLGEQLQPIGGFVWRAGCCDPNGHPRHF